MTEKQQRFLEEYRGKGDGARAARAAGYSEKRANTIAWHILHNSEPVRKEMNEALDSVGLGADTACAVIIEGLSAEVVKTATHEGNITDEKSYPDYQTRHKYLETLIKLRDMFPADKLKMTVNPFEGRTVKELNYYIAHQKWPEDE